MMPVLAATGAGAAVGWLCGLVPVWPVVRLTAAAVMGYLVGAIGVAVLVLVTFRSGSGGLAAVSFGVSEVVILGVPALVLVPGVCYVVLRRLGWSSEGLATYGPIICGAGAALTAALWVTRGMSISGGG
jgi:hypothetical protein